MRTQLSTADPKGPHMPAVTANTLTLPRIEAPTVLAQDRPLISLTTAPSGFEGEGFPVRRAFAGIPKEVLDPFIMMDQMGSVDYPPYEARGTDWHPHRGFETITYMIVGAVEHHDSLGNKGVVGPGEVQWMTAASGIIHAEYIAPAFKAKGGTLHGFQIWVNLTAAHKMQPPAYQQFGAENFPTITEGNCSVKVIAGTYKNAVSPMKTKTELCMWHVNVPEDGQLSLELPASFQCAVYVATGSVMINGQHLHDGKIIFPDNSENNSFNISGHQLATLLVIGGVPINEPIASYGPFVMNTEQEIEEAILDYQSGKFGTIDR